MSRFRDVTFSLNDRTSPKWATMTAAQVAKGDILQNPRGRGLEIASEVEVLDVKQEITRAIITTTTWHTIKHPDDPVLVKRTLKTGEESRYGVQSGRYYVNT